MLLRISGLLLLIEAAFMLVPLFTAIVYQEKCFLPILLSIGITAGAGALMMPLRSSHREMKKRDAIFLTGMIWIVLSLFGMLPFLLSGTHLSVTDAFFETCSGFTTTGASVIDTLKDVPKAIMMWRCVIQWIGGLGIILFTLAVIPMLNYSGGMRLFNAEVTGITHDKLRPRVSFTAKGLWSVYIILTGVLMILLAFSDMSAYDAICYGLSTMSTGGFATSDMSIHTWDSLYIKIVFAIFMFIGGVNFSLIYTGAWNRKNLFWKNESFRWYVYILIICYGLLCLNILTEGLYTNPASIMIDPLFQAISILSSTGIVQPDFANWGGLSTLVLIVMMFMGACAGSTSGGAKIDRFIVLFKFLKNEFYKMMHPNAITTVRINGKGTSPEIVSKTLAFLLLYIIIIIVGGMILCLLGLPLKDGFFCALSAISNTGLGTDTTGISGNFGLIPDPAKWLLSFIMLIGRLELFTILLIFTPAFWKN
ncbi:MAG: TrkH family potassium uptake protein [Muribaculaceae bacterium]|nr:TrkH family potassium uptake protein [Muribaculaceae bacterium]